MGKKKTAKSKVRNVEQAAGDGGEILPSFAAEGIDEIPPGIAVSMFDCSVANHFRAVDLISTLSGDNGELDVTEIERLKSSITFLREWKHFNYQSKSIRFTRETENPLEKDVSNGIKLPQLSAANVPKKNRQNGTTVSPESSNDFIMHVGGSVWALDWCPRVHQSYDCGITSEFIAIAAHPPDSTYHKMGAPLIGRGVVQIWCLLTIASKEEEPGVKKKPKQKPRQSSDKPRGRPRKYPLSEKSSNQPRGRPKKLPIIKSVDTENTLALVDVDPLCIDSSNLSPTEEPIAQRDAGKKRKGEELVQPKPRSSPTKNLTNESVDELDSLAVQLFEDSPVLLCSEPTNSETTKGKSTRPKNPTRKARKKLINYSVDELDSFEEVHGVQLTEDLSTMDQSYHTRKPSKRTKTKRVTEYVEDVDSDAEYVQPIAFEVSGTDEPSSPEIENNEDIGAAGKCCSIPVEVSLPRAVLCLAHNGKVAWDVKWQPCDVSDTKPEHRMGFLAVLLGSGALEVWEVPTPRALKFIYSVCQKEGTDPRFIKLEPVFRCSMLMSGDRRSIPLAVEWSTSSPHDLILAGCHDGVVALWKFSANHSSKDTRPLLCFSADTVPIRTLSWAPVPSDPESANVFVTAGHKGLKFWDMRDPSRPLWELNPTQRIIYSLDWVPDPRCIIVAFDDGTLRILGIMKAANDVAVTGKPFSGTAQQGLHSYFCSSFPIWSVGVSRSTGIVAYCSADGTTLRFQLTRRAVEKDPLRSRVSHFLCGSIIEEENSTLTVNTPLADTPFPMKKSSNEYSNAPRSIRGFITLLNQEKRAKEEETAKAHTRNNQALAVYDSEDARNASGDDDLLVRKKGKEAATPKVSNNKRLKNSGQELVCINDKEESEKMGEVKKEIEVFPPKMVAMHRVRWNMNKGCERWLCFGGAAGIVRCQFIEKSDIN